MANPTITFCVMTFSRTNQILRCLESIRAFCPVDYDVKLLLLDEPNSKLRSLLLEFGDRLQPMTLPNGIWVGVGGGRQMLAEAADADFTMVLDDDAYLNTKSVGPCLEILDGNPRIGAVSMPHYAMDGQLLYFGGNRLVVRGNSIHYELPEMKRDFEEVQMLPGSAFLFRTEMIRSRAFAWDDSMGSFEDLDKSLQICKAGVWKQATVTGASITHDHTWLGSNQEYFRHRWNAFALLKSYHAFQRKWHLRFYLTKHLFYELLYPALSLTRSQRLLANVNRMIEKRDNKRIRRTMPSSVLLSAHFN
jgi:GT2 family glycosyltransferase